MPRGGRRGNHLPPTSEVVKGTMAERLTRGSSRTGGPKQEGQGEREEERERRGKTVTLAGYFPKSNPREVPGLRRRAGGCNKFSLLYLTKFATPTYDMSITNLTPSQLRQAAVLKEKIETLQAELGAILGSTGKETAAAPAAKGKKKISAAGIAKIRAAQKARWAKFRASKGK